VRGEHTRLACGCLKFGSQRGVQPMTREVARLGRDHNLAHKRGRALPQAGHCGRQLEIDQLGCPFTVSGKTKPTARSVLYQV
jgi:hypothetical protein